MNQRITQYWINRSNFVASLFLNQAISYDTLEEENRRIWEAIQRNPEVKNGVLAGLQSKLRGGCSS